MKWIAQIKFSQWLILSFASFLLIMVTLGAYSTRQLENINQPALELQAKWMPATLAATEMKSSFNNYRVALLLRIEAEDPAEVEYTEGQLKKRMQAFRENETLFVRLVGTQAERNLYETSRRAIDDYLLVAENMLALARQNQKAAAMAQWRNNTREKMNAVIKAFDELVKFNVEGGRAASEGSTRLLASASEGTLFAVALAVLFQLLANLQVYRRFSASLGLLKRVGVHTCASSNELATLIHQLEATIEQQAASSQHIVTAAKEISSTAKALGGNMDEIARVSTETSHWAANSQDGLDQLDDTMRRMARASNEISAKLGVLDEKAGNINAVVKSIGKIAEQTNLLSLNAAIEAEKAGEYGMGFSVVAREIRRLADQTSIALFDIGQIVKEMQSQVSISVMGMDKFAREIGLIVEDVRKISWKLNGAIDQTIALGPRFELIYEGMQTQSLGTLQITEAMSQFNEGIQQTAQSVRNSRRTVDVLAEASQDVQRVVKALG